MTIRADTIQRLSKRTPSISARESLKHSLLFASKVFDRKQIEQNLPKKQAANWLGAMDGTEKIEKEHLDSFAEALKEWATRHGATHYTHWFQQLSGIGQIDSMIEQMRGIDLLQSENSQGYTFWDPTTPPFLFAQADGLTLYIPALFFSRKGDSLDPKIPLLKSVQKMENVVSRLLKIADMTPCRVFPVLEIEQNYFAIDRTLFYLRPDLLEAGRTLFGAKIAKGEGDRSFTVIDERVLAFMRDFEEAAIELGIPLKSCHAQAAPSQFVETALFEKAHLAIDHNTMLVALMQQKAQHHNLACLFHEKPFASMNGLAKQCNWSIATDQGVNLLDSKGNDFIFLTLLAGLLHSLQNHSDLLLPGTVYLGEELQNQIEKIIHGKEKSSFNDNKFELRGLGSQPLAWSITVLNTIVADSLSLILDEIEDCHNRNAEADLCSNAMTVLRKHFQTAKSLFTDEEIKRDQFHAFSTLREAKIQRLFQDVLSPEELESRLEVFFEQHAKRIETECNLMIELFRTEVFPAGLHHQKEWACSMAQLGELNIANQPQLSQLEIFSQLMNDAVLAINDLEKIKKQAEEFGWEARAKVLCELALPRMEIARQAVDQLEGFVPDHLWPLPKYRELLFLK